jgi:hypothetical protein
MKMALSKGQCKDAISPRRHSVESTSPQAVDAKVKVMQAF